MAATTVSLTQTQTAKHQIAFIDTSVSGYDALLSGIQPGVEAVLIDGAHDGLAQVAAALAGRTDISAVHLFTHGGPGMLQLGSAQLSLANIDSYAADLAVVRAAMAPGGDLMVYGCDVAAGEKGKAFVDALAAATGADVAASDDATGNALLGADWTLEAQTGPIETPVALTAAGQLAFVGTLSVGSENFDNLGGPSDFDGYKEMIYNGWKFTTNSATSLAIANADDGYPYSGLYSGNFTDRLVMLNSWDGDAGSTTVFTMESADLSNFKLNSVAIGQNSAVNWVTIQGYDGAGSYLAPVTLNLTTNYSGGGITYTVAGNDPGGLGNWGTLSFGTNYSNVYKISFSFNSPTDLYLDDINVSAAADLTPPAISNNIGLPANGYYHAGQVLNFTVNFNENVTVTGTDSTLDLTIGGTVRKAAFVSDTGFQLKYSYTVQAGDLDTDGISVNGISLGSSTIRDAAGNNADLSLAGHLTSTAGIIVDTVAPAVSGLIGVPANGTYASGSNLDFTVSFDENVTVTGTDSTLGLTVGASAQQATFLSSTGNTVTYRYHLVSGLADTDGIAIGAISLGTSTIRDAAGNNANLSLAAHVPSTSGILIDSSGPVIAGTIGVPGNGTYTAGQAMTFTVSFDENVVVTGTDGFLHLLIGGIGRDAMFVSSSGNTITYKYTVQAGDLDADGIQIAGVSPGTGTLRDTLGNDATYLSPAGHVPALTGVLVDGVAPAVAGNIAVPANGHYNVGETLSFTVNFDDNVTVTGADSTLGLTIGASARSAQFASSTANSVTYTYTVQAGDLDQDGIAVGAISLGTTTIRDAAGNNANLALAGHLPSTAGIVVDTVAPAVSSAVAAPPNGTYVAGQYLDFTVIFDEQVTVTGADSTLALTIGSSARNADFLMSTGSMVTYRYTVQAGDVDADGIAVGAIALGSSTIRDAAGNDANVALGGHVPSTAGVLVDGTVPSISGNIAVPAAGMYTPGQTLTFTVAFDENVTVTGTDSTLGLTIGGSARSATFASKSGNTVTYTYTVQAGDNDGDGIAVGGISLGASTIRDAAGNNANLSLAGHVPSLSAVLVDGGAPSVSGNIDVPGIGSYREGQALSFTIHFDENVTVTGTDSTLGLDIGGVYRSAHFSSSTANSVTYTYTVQAGEVDTSGIQVGDIALGSTTIRDAAGNDANLSLAGHLPSTTGILVDTVPPNVGGSVVVPANGTYIAGQHLDFSVSFDENVTVSGTDSTLALTIGSSSRSASFLSSSGNTVTYRYTVQAGDTDADGIAVGVISLGSSTIRDAAGNDASLSLAGQLPSTSGVLVDGTAPAVTGNIGVPGGGTYTAGQTLHFTVTFGEDVIVTGSDSTLGLTIGSTARSAQFASSLGNTITYAYTVQANDNDTDGIAVGSIDPGSSTIRDAAGNNADLSLAGHVPTLSAVRVDNAAPNFLNATVNGARLVMTYADAGLLDAAHAPTADAFTVMVGGNKVAVAAVAVDGAAHTVTLTLASAVANGTAVTVAYDDPSAANDAAAIQDAAGNDAASLPATSVVNNTPQPVVVPPETATTIDGVAVQVGTIVNSDGSVSQALTIPVVTASRVDDTGNNTVADIPLLKGADGSSLLTVQVPVGFGLQATGFSAPHPAGDSLDDLVREIKAHTANGSQEQSQLAGGGAGFLGHLAGGTSLIVQTIVPTVGAGGGTPGAPLTITGTPATGGNPYTALVLDGRGLPAGTTLELHNVEFAAVMGDVRVTGGTGQQNVWGDGGSQYIVLGPGDDILHGGAGDDTVGSGDGNDQIFGDDGNDVVFGGAGNDVIDGGTGRDTLLLAGASRADYSMRVVDGKLAITQLNGGTDGADQVANVEVLRYANGDADFNTSDVATLVRMYSTLFNRLPDAAGLNYWIGAYEGGTALSSIAGEFVKGMESSGQYGAADDSHFVQALYESALHREASASEAQWWVDQLASGKVDRGDVLLGFANSAEKVALVGTISTSIDTL